MISLNNHMPTRPDYWRFWFGRNISSIVHLLTWGERKSTGGELILQALLPLILSLDLEALLFKFDMPAFGSIWRDNLKEGNRYACDKFAIFLFFEKSGGHQSSVGAVWEHSPSTNLDGPGFDFLTRPHMFLYALLVLFSVLTGFSPDNPVFASLKTNIWLDLLCFSLIFSLLT